MRRVIAGGVALLVIGMAIWLLSVNGKPQTPTLESISTRVMSPFCPGLTLEECPSRPSVELRGAIQEKIEEGWTTTQIEDWLIGNFGESALGIPRGLAPWIVPSIVLAVGLFVAYNTVKKFRKGSSVLETELTPSERQNLESEMKTFIER